MPFFKCARRIEGGESLEASFHVPVTTLIGGIKKPSMELFFWLLVHKIIRLLSPCFSKVFKSDFIKIYVVPNPLQHIPT